MKFLFLFISIPLLFTTCSLGDAKQPVNWKNYSAKNYTISYPSDWRLDSVNSKAELILFAPTDYQTPLYKENINLVIQPKQNGEPGPDDLDNYVALSEKQVEEYGGTLLDSKRLEDDRGEFHMFSYRAEFNGTQFKFKQHVWVINGNAYLLTYSGSPDGIDPYEKTVDSIFTSFIVK